MEIFKEPKIDWLGKKWILIGVSGVLAAAGLVSIYFRGLQLGLDFTGGTLVYAKFQQEPQLERIRRALSAAGLRAEEVKRYDVPSKNEVQIRTALIESRGERELTLESERVVETLRSEYDRDQHETGKSDLNNLARSALSAQLQEIDAEKLRDERTITEFTQHYEEMAAEIVNYRNQQGGLFKDFSETEGLGLPEAMIQAIQEKFYLGKFTVISVESVGPKVGSELQKRARMAVLFSLFPMLVYIAFRFPPVFPPIYGVAAVAALFHDVFITLGIFSITGKEITITVVAALLTVVGYSINDTIVIFDRIRENLKLMRRNDLSAIINASINQTLNRTITTSVLTFLAVFALYMFGGQVLNGFSFALVLGVIVGTYSTLAIATPVVLWWQTFLERKKARVL